MNNQNKAISPELISKVFSPEKLSEIVTGMYQGKPLLGPSGLFTDMLKVLTQASLQAEMDLHLSENKTEEGDNRRNGYNSKMLKQDLGVCSSKLHAIVTARLSLN